MNVPSARRWASSTCLLTLLLAAACTPGGGADPSPTPVSTSATPTETAQEREQRLAYAEADANYRSVRKEFGRLTMAGGASSATSVLQAGAGGPYLADLVKALKAYKETGYRTVGSEVIGYVHPDGYSTSSLLLDVCEDDRHVYAVDREGEELRNPDVLTISLEVRNVDGHWKVWSGQSRKVESCAT